MIKVHYIHPDERQDAKGYQMYIECHNPFMTRTEAVVLKMQLEGIIKKIDGERK